MSGLRRAPRLRWQRVSDGLKQQRVAGVEQYYSAAPIPPRSNNVGDAETGAVTDDLSDQDSNEEYFTLTAVPQDRTLEFLPVQESWNVFINGLAGEYGDDFTVSDQVLTILNGTLVPIVGDRIRIQYDYLTGMPTAPTPFVSDYHSAVMAAGPVGYWRMDDTGTALVDQSSGHHDATGISGTGYTRHQTSLLPTDTNYSTLFTDNGTRFQIPSSSAFDFTTAFSCIFWTDHGASGTIGVVAYDNRWAVVTTGGAIQLKVNGSAVAASSNTLMPATSASKFLGITWDGTTVRYYRDGVLRESGSYAGPITGTSVGHLDIGSGGNDTLGKLDEVALFNRALTDTEISTMWSVA